MRSVFLIYTLVLLACGGPKTASKQPADDCKGIAFKDCICTQHYDPVCGCDGKTYGNACEAGCAGVKKYVKGECPPPTGSAADCKTSPRGNCVCPENIDPVCGCDGKTYNNSCEAECAGVLKYTTGACE